MLKTREMSRMLTVLTYFFILAATSCGKRTGTDLFDTTYYRPEYAGGFEIKGFRDSSSRVIRVTGKWQESDSSAFELFIARNGETPPAGFTGQVLEGKADRIVAMSSSYVAMLDLIGKTGSICGVSGLRFISNGNIRENAGKIADVGNEADADFEKLTALSPDIVLLYGVNGASPMEERLKILGIPFLYVGEYLETSPLGRAEWIVALAEITGDIGKGTEEFGKIENRYVHLKNLIPENASVPEVMLNVPYGDIWYMSPPGTGLAAIIRDAGGKYIYEGGKGNKSCPVDMEEACLMVSEADFWLNTGQYGHISEIVEDYPELSDAGCIVSGNVFNCDRRRTEGGGNDYWESGQARPDLVLEDIIRILHPELLPDCDTSSFHYYRKLKP